MSSDASSSPARRVIVLGAATSAGTHRAGQDLAPDALRAAGFVDALTAAGLQVSDAGNVVHEVFRPDRGDAPARNVSATARVARAVADAVERHAARGTVVIVLGGDCTITLGVLAGLQRAALAAVALTEVNPSYDPSGESLRRYVEAVTGALTHALLP